MPLWVNQEKVEEQFIKNEMARMRSDFKRMYPDKDKVTREKILFDWALENIAEKILIKQYAEKKNIKITDSRINSEMNRIYRNFENESESSEKAVQQDSGVILIRNEIRVQLMVEIALNEIKRGVKKPTKKDLKKYYYNNRDKYITPASIHVKHIVKQVGSDSFSQNKALKVLREAKKKLESGESFESVGNTYSDCPGKGLDLGYFTRGKMVSDFEEVVFSLDRGEVSNVFRTEFGYHIAKLCDKKPSRDPEFEEIKEQLKKDYTEKAIEQKINNFTDALKKDAEIKYTDIEKVVQSAKIGFTLKKSLNFVLVKPSGPDCNLACQYCFYLEKKNLFGKKKHRMSIRILKEMIRKTVSNNPDDINFGWQGGEPTLLGLDFFRKAVQFQKEYSQPGQNVGNSIQTNGILIDEEWAEFLKKNNFLVGLSLDGPASIHDRYRKTRDKKGTSHRVEQTAKLLLHKQVLVNSLTTVNDYSVRFPEEIYNYLTTLGFKYLQFIPLVETDKDNQGAASFSAKGEQYGEFLCRIFDLWRNSFQQGRPAVSVRFFDAVFHRYIGREARECYLQKECGTYLVVEHNGDVYPCDFFVDPVWKLGNIRETEPLLLLNSDKQKRFAEMKADLPGKCKGCQWLPYCRGGCSKDRLRDPRDKYVNHFCAGYSLFFEYADSFMKQLADNFIRKEHIQNKLEATVEQGTQNIIGKKVGRNDPCPCGSGKKYKKCCGKK